MTEWQGAADPLFAGKTTVTRSLDLGLIASSRIEMLFGPGTTLFDLIAAFNSEDPDCIISKFEIYEGKNEDWYLQIFVTYVDPLRQEVGSRHVAYTISQTHEQSSPQLSRDSCRIDFMHNRGSGYGSEIFSKGLKFDFQAPHVRELQVTAVNVGRYAWRHLPLFFDAESRETIKGVLYYLNEHLNLKIPPKTIETIKTPLDVAKICHLRSLNQDILKYVNVIAVQWQRKLGAEGFPFSLTAQQARYIAHYPGILALMMMRDYSMGWNAATKKLINL